MAGLGGLAHAVVSARAHRRDPSVSCQLTALSWPGSSHRLSHIAPYALSVIHAHACVSIMACGNYYITIFQLSCSRYRKYETWA